MTEHKCQQFQLYAAEGAVFTGREFLSVERMQEFVDGLRETWWWQMWYPNVMRVEVYRRQRNRRESLGWYEEDKWAGAIEMLPQHWNELTVLHELAHVLAEARYGSKAHDPWFARVYLELVALVMGSDVYLMLQRSFDEHDIRYDHEPEVRFGTARPMPPVQEEPCQAKLWHGPGHQSSTRCRLTGSHDVHEAVYAGDRFATWRGDEAMTGYFDEPPEDDE